MSAGALLRPAQNKCFMAYTDQEGLLAIFVGEAPEILNVPDPGPYQPSCSNTVRANRAIDDGNDLRATRQFVITVENTA